MSEHKTQCLIALPECDFLTGTREERDEEFEEHITRCWDEIEKLLPPELTFTSKRAMIRNLEGPLNVCQEFALVLQEKNLGTLAPDDIIFQL